MVSPEHPERQLFVGSYCQPLVDGVTSILLTTNDGAVVRSVPLVDGVTSILLTTNDGAVVRSVPLVAGQFMWWR